MPNRVDIAAFQKVMIVYNRNSGKQLFASMLARVNAVSYTHLTLPTNREV